MGTISNIAIDRYGEALTNKDFIEPKLVHEEVESYIRKSGGKIKSRNLADVCICVPDDETFRIQELHLPVYHMLCIAAENEFFGE